MRKHSVSLLLGLILFLAFLLRFYSVTDIPPSLNWDEVSIGYNAYSILHTGHDEWGEFMPVHFKAYGEYKLPTQIYASVPAIAVFGLNDFAVRLTPIIYGTLTVLFLYFLSVALFKRRDVALISALFLAVSPWHIQLTRGSFESAFATMWVVLGIWFLIKGFSHRGWFIWSMIPFALATYTYNTARIFVPLFLLVCLLAYARQFLKLKKTLFMAFFVFVVLMIPYILFVLSGGGNARYKLVSVTDDPGLIPRIEFNRNHSTLPNPLPQVIHNRFTYVGYYFSRNYLSHISPQFLFTNGAPHKQHHVQGVGELYLVQAPLLLLGLYMLFRKKNTYRVLLISWPLLTLVPVSLTNDSMPHALRTLIASPMLQIVSGYGLVELYSWLRLKRKGTHWLQFVYGVMAVIVSLLVINFGIYLYRYYEIYPVMYSRDWQYGNKQVVEYIRDHYEDYDLIVYSRTYGEPHMFTLFYLQYPPSQFYKSANLIRFETNDWVRVLQFDKFYFPVLGDEGTRFTDIVAKNPGKRILFIGKPGDFPNQTKLIEIPFLNGKPDFEIVESK